MNIYQPEVQFALEKKEGLLLVGVISVTWNQHVGTRGCVGSVEGLGKFSAGSNRQLEEGQASIQAVWPGLTSTQTAWY